MSELRSCCRPTASSELRIRHRTRRHRDALRKHRTLTAPPHLNRHPRHYGIYPAHSASHTAFTTVSELRSCRTPPAPPWPNYTPATPQYLYCAIIIPRPQHRSGRTAPPHTRITTVSVLRVHYRAPSQRYLSCAISPPVSPRYPDCAVARLPHYAVRPAQSTPPFFTPRYPSFTFTITAYCTAASYLRSYHFPFHSITVSVPHMHHHSRPHHSGRTAATLHPYHCDGRTAHSPPATAPRNTIPVLRIHHFPPIVPRYSNCAVGLLPRLPHHGARPAHLSSHTPPHWPDHTPLPPRSQHYGIRPAHPAPQYLSCAVSISRPHHHGIRTAQLPSPSRITTVSVLRIRHASRNTIPVPRNYHPLIVSRCPDCAVAAHAFRITISGLRIYHHALARPHWPAIHFHTTTVFEPHIYYFPPPHFDGPHVNCAVYTVFEPHIYYSPPPHCGARPAHFISRVSRIAVSVPRIPSPFNTAASRLRSYHPPPAPQCPARTIIITHLSHHTGRTSHASPHLQNI